MPQLVPDGIFRQPYMLKLLVAASPTFREIVRADDSAEALKRIHYPYARPDRGELPPRAIIQHDADVAPYERRKIGTGVWKCIGGLHLEFDFYVPHNVATFGAENSNNWMAAKCGAILKEMEILAGTDEPIVGLTHLNMQSYMVVDGPDELDAAEMGIPDLDGGEVPRQLWQVEFEVGFF